MKIKKLLGKVFLILSFLSVFSGLFSVNVSTQVNPGSGLDSTSESLGGLFEECRSSEKGDMTGCIRSIVNLAFVIGVFMLIIKITAYQLKTVASLDSGNLEPVKKTKELVRDGLIGLIILGAPALFLNMFNESTTDIFGLGDGSGGSSNSDSTNEDIERQILIDNDCYMAPFTEEDLDRCGELRGNMDELVDDYLDSRVYNLDTAVNEIKIMESSSTDVSAAETYLKGVVSDCNEKIDWENNNCGSLLAIKKEIKNNGTKGLPGLEKLEEILKYLNQPGYTDLNNNQTIA